jgi:PAS domain-containing protein
MSLEENKEAINVIELVTRLFDSQLDSVVWFNPVFVNGAEVPVDFEVGYCNSSACHILQTPRHKVLGSTLLTSALMDKVSTARIFEQCLQVWETNEPVEFIYYSPGADKHFNVQRSKIEGGILSITRDHTLLEKTKKEKVEQADLLDQLIKDSPYGVSVYESIRNKQGEIEDFRLRLANQKSAEITDFSLKDLYRYTVKELMLKRGHTDYFTACKNVVETGKAVYTEYYAKNRQQWISFSITRFNDGYLLNYFDITNTKRLEAEARFKAEMLQSIMDASITGLYALEAIYGYSGKVLDFKFTMMNKAAERLLNFNKGDLSKTFLTLYPTAKSNGLFDHLTTVIETGIPCKMDFLYKGENLNGWYSLSISKMGENGLVQSFSELNKKD